MATQPSLSISTCSRGLDGKFCPCCHFKEHKPEIDENESVRYCLNCNHWDSSHPNYHENQPSSSISAVFKKYQGAYRLGGQSQLSLAVGTRVKLSEEDAGAGTSKGFSGMSASSSNYWPMVMQAG